MAQKSSDLDAKVNVKSPQFVPLPLAQTKNDDKNYFENKSFMQSMRRHSMDSVFSCWAEGGRGEVIFVFSLVPKCVPMRFPKFRSCSPKLSQ
jgi:hypothetical protein